MQNLALVSPVEYKIKHTEINLKIEISSFTQKLNKKHFKQEFVIFNILYENFRVFLIQPNSI